MGDTRFVIRFHHKGEFLKTKFSNGTCTEIANSVDADLFSYSVLMEYVKNDLGYIEIGGIYINKGKMGGWKLVANDKDFGEFIQGFSGGESLDFYIDTIVGKGIEPLEQMQPHVVVRPRPSLFEAKRLQPKRKYVTIQSIQQEQKNKKNASEENATVRRKLPIEDNVLISQQDIAPKDVIDGENIKESIGIMYERKREMTIAQNKERFAALNLSKLSDGLSIISKQKKGKDTAKVQEASEAYYPENDSDPGSDEDEITHTSKQTKQIEKMKVVNGRTTRSKANIDAIAVEKEGTCLNSAQAVDGETVPYPGPSSTKHLKRQSNEGIGSIAAFLALRESQKLKQVENAQEKDNVEPVLCQTDHGTIETSKEETRKNKNGFCTCKEA
ncbi:uncharacterized protein [Euphorbia lathyris]|uniref:uncharacterized protein isoform X2 n=1 Tax=Euphorbia lathyris TaxID=212925 RepID=UPI003313E35D